jgi:hypothetical protein
MPVRSYYLKTGRMRFYSHSTGGGPFYMEVPFRGTITAAIDRPRVGETIILDRMRMNADMHFVQGSDDAMLAALPFSCNFRLLNSEPSYSKLLIMLRTFSGSLLSQSPPGKLIGPHLWTSTKGTTQIRNADFLSTALVTTPVFSDPEKWCVNVEALWEDPDNVNHRGFRWAEVYFPPGQVTEGEQDVMIDLNGEVHGAITTITSFSSGTES